MTCIHHIHDVLSAVEAVERFEAQKRIDIPTRSGVTFFSGKDIWLYDIREDDVTCEICRNIADQASLMGGFNGNTIRALFPFLEIIDENTIKAHSHMPRDDNCRCLLLRYVGVPEDRVPAQKHLVPAKMEPDKKVNQLPTGNKKRMKAVEPTKNSTV